MGVTSRLRSAVGRLADAFAPPPLTRVESATAAGIADVSARLAHKRAAAGEVLKRSAAGKSPPNVPGVGWPASLVDPLLRTDAEQARIWGSKDAKYGRASTTLGLTPQAWATSSGVDITLERLAQIYAEVDHLGVLTRKADLDFAILRKDTHLKTQQRARAAACYRAPLQLRPSDDSPLAAAVCAFVRKVVDGIDGFASAEEAMWTAAAYGYSGLEVVWRTPRDITIQVGKTRLTVPQAQTIGSLEWIHPRSFRWSPLARQMLLQSGGEYFDPFTNPDGSPTHKLILHSGDVGDPHQGGYMFGCNLLHMFKHQATARLAVGLELLGIQTPYMQFDEGAMQQGDQYAPDEDFEAALSFLSRLGRGLPALLNRKFGEVKVTPASSGLDARGAHMALIGHCNGEQSKAVAGQTLLAEAGGNGSYALANAHGDSKEDVWLIDLRRSCDTHQAQTLAYIVEANLYALVRAFRARPEQILAVVPRAYRVMDRRIDPSQRMAMFVSAKRDLGLVIDPRQVEEELGIRTLPAEQPEGAFELPEGDGETYPEDTAEDIAEEPAEPQGEPTEPTDTPE